MSLSERETIMLWLAKEIVTCESIKAEFQLKKEKELVTFYEGKIAAYKVLLNKLSIWEKLIN